MMTPIPDDVRRLLSERIHSLEEVEVLLLLRRSGLKEWTAEAVSQELRTRAHSADQRLSDLRALGLLSAGRTVPLSYRYDPETEQLRELVDRLARSFAERYYAAIALIYSKPIQPVRVFPDAMRPRGDKPNPWAAQRSQVPGTRTRNENCP